MKRVSPPVGPRPSHPASVAPVVLAALVVVGGAGPAFGYVRARDEATLSAFFWADPRKVFELANPASETGVSTAVLRQAAETASLSWSAPTLACTGVDLSVARDATDSQASAFDHRNRIIMTIGSWCRRDPTATMDCNRNPDAVALTTLYTRHHPNAPDDGEIQEADIEVNAAGRFQWGVIPDGPVVGRDLENTYDLTSVLTHEMGHFIGLAHTCRVPNDLLLVDDIGDLSPLCTDVAPENQSLIEDATMYPFMSPTDVKLRTLTPDDARAACEMYPPSSLPYDEWVGSGGCSQAPGSSARGPIAPVLVMIGGAVSALLGRRTRRVRRARTARNCAPRPRNRPFP